MMQKKEKAKAAERAFFAASAAFEYVYDEYVYMLAILNRYYQLFWFRQFILHGCVCLRYEKRTLFLNQYDVAAKVIYEIQNSTINTAADCFTF